MENETRPPAADAVPQVLENSDLLNEILLRVGFHTTLVRTALVCKRWLGHVSDRAFLDRFRELHPPRLLGFYVEDRALPTCTPPFVPVLPQSPEVAAVLRHASFNLVAFLLRNFSRLASRLELHRALAWLGPSQQERLVAHLEPARGSPVWLELFSGSARAGPSWLVSSQGLTHDCRNGSVFCGMYNSWSESDITYRVHNPLCPARDKAIPTFPKPEFNADYYCALSRVLSKEESHGLEYIYLYGESNFCTAQPQYRVHVYMLQDGLRCARHVFHIDQLPRPRPDPKAVLVDNKIYMAADLGRIIVLDLTTLSFSTIQLPQGVEQFGYGTTLLSRASDASGLYVIHAKEFQLYIWFHKGDNWLLVDTVCLREMCANLKKSGCTIQKLYLKGQVLDYGDFVFLGMGGCALQLDIKCRTLHKVYETKFGCLGNIHPCMMIWPPKFPKFKNAS